MKTLYNIQFARALAALFVVYAHIGYPGAVFGHFGVDIFFVISGFIMTMICSKEPHHFFLRRLVRIVPLYWLITLLVLVLSYVQPRLLNSTTPNAGNFIKSLLFIPYAKENGAIHPMLDVGWTLNYEMYFYVAIGLALIAVPGRYAVRSASVGLILVYIVLKCYLAFKPFTSSWLEVAASFYSSYFIFEFVMGVAAYYISQSRMTRKVGIVPNLMVAGLSLVFLIYNQLAAPFGGVSPALTVGLPALLFVTALLLLEKKHMVLTKVTILGDASYALYLTNQFVIEGFRKIIGRFLHLAPYSIISCLLMVVFSLLVAVSVFLWIEKPIHNKLRSFV